MAAVDANSTVSVWSSEMTKFASKMAGAYWSTEETIMLIVVWGQAKAQS